MGVSDEDLEAFYRAELERADAVSARMSEHRDMRPARSSVEREVAVALNVTAERVRRTGDGVPIEAWRAVSEAAQAVEEELARRRLPVMGRPFSDEPK